MPFSTDHTGDLCASAEEVKPPPPPEPIPIGDAIELAPGELHEGSDPD